MRDDELEQVLKGAFDAQACASVGEHAGPPAPRFAEAAGNGNVNVHSIHRSRTRRTARWAAPFAAAAAVVGVVAGVVAIESSSGSDTNREAARPSAASHLPKQPTTVHVKLLNDDGATYGVGMPVIAYFSQRITDARALQRATVATVDKHVAAGAWYFEKSLAGKGPIEAHFRLEQYWPANAAVHVSIPIKGLPAGGGLVFDNDLITDFKTGAKHVATVSGHLMSLNVNDRYYDTYSVSLGAAGHDATRPGTKVIMEKNTTVTTNKVPHHSTLRFAQRLTYGGEYLCGAPWNATDIKKGIDSSGGSTNLLPADAKRLYVLLRIGDVVKFEHTTGQPMTMDAGYGDWTVSWAQWLTGGLVRTH